LGEGRDCYTWTDTDRLKAWAAVRTMECEAAETDAAWRSSRTAREGEKG